MKSVKSKVIALVLSGIFLTAFVIGGTSVINSERVIVEDSSKIMNLLCENRVNEVNSLFANIEQSVKTLTVYASNSLDDLERFKTDDEYVTQYTESLRNVAVNAAVNTAGAVTVYIRYDPAYTDPQSGLFCSRNRTGTGFENLTPTNLSLYDSSDIEHVGWFYLPAQRKSGTWIAPYFNQNIQVYMVSYVVPIYVENVFVGVVGMDIDFTLLESTVALTKVYNTGYAFLTDDQGFIVYHKDLESGTDLSQYNHGEFTSLVDTLRETETSGSSLLSYSYQGESRKAAFRSLSNGMRFVLTAPTSEIDAQATQLMLQIIVTAVLIVLIAVVFTIIFTRRLVRPLQELTEAATKIAEGDLSVSITHQSKDEVGVLAESFRRTVEHLHKYISYINELAYRDSLTGVKNKTAYLEVIKRMDDLTRLKRPQYAVLVFDINGLKMVNDTRGHDFGDMLIINACQIICRVFKRSPIYRIGGDEFVALLENTDYEQYPELLVRFEAELELHNRNTQNELPVSVARGIAVYSEETDLTYNDVFKRADNAMYCNKTEMKSKMAKEKPTL